MKAILTWRPACPLFILQRANAVCQALSRLQDPGLGKGQVSPKPSPGNHVWGTQSRGNTTQNKSKHCRCFCGARGTWREGPYSRRPCSNILHGVVVPKDHKVPGFYVNSSSVSRTQPQPSVSGVNTSHCHQDTFLKSRLTKSLLLLQPPTKDACSTYPSENTRNSQQGGTALGESKLFIYSMSCTKGHLALLDMPSKYHLWPGLWGLRQQNNPVPFLVPLKKMLVCKGPHSQPFSVMLFPGFPNLCRTSIMIFLILFLLGNLIYFPSQYRLLQEESRLDLSPQCQSTAHGQVCSQCLLKAWKQIM